MEISGWWRAIRLNRTHSHSDSNTLVIMKTWKKYVVTSVNPSGLVQHQFKRHLHLKKFKRTEKIKNILGSLEIRSNLS